LLSRAGTRRNLRHDIAQGMPYLIAIDGPAASGKSSVARIIAQRLGFLYVNSGAMYRAVTWRLLQCKIDLHDVAAVATATEQAQIVCFWVGGESRLSIDALEPSDHLRDDNVNSSVSLVARVPRVREILGRHMRQCAADHDVVVEGRDIGSVVFPDTPFKFYIDASLQVRTRRRHAQGQRDQIAVRDRFDSSRGDAPLVIAPDAEVIDSSQLTIEEVVEEVLGRLLLKGFRGEVRPAGLGWR
jgi:CMP/dCMP kinase